MVGHRPLASDTSHLGVDDSAQIDTVIYFLVSSILRLAMVSKYLNPDKALIFRITHKHNAAQIFAEGCFSPTEVERLSLNKSWRSNYVVIGN